MTLTAVRDLLLDERMWCVSARITVLPNESSHFARASNGQILVSVLTNQHSVPIWGTFLGGDILGRGVWIVPAVGTEVVVCFDNGDFEGDPFIVAKFGKSPEELAENVTLIVDDSVEIRSLNGVAQRLLTEADASELKDAIRNAATAPTDGGSAFKANLLANLSTWPTGTSVLKAE